MFLPLTFSCTARDDWAQVAPPVLPEETSDVPFDGPLPDGVYWGELTVVHGSDTAVFLLGKARFGAFCQAWVAARGLGEECLDDYYVEDAPPAAVALTDAAVVSVAALDDPSLSYRIEPAVLAALLRGATDPHPGYVWTPFPFLLRVSSGALVSAEQVWVP